MQRALHTSLTIVVVVFFGDLANARTLSTVRMAGDTSAKYLRGWKLLFGDDFDSFNKNKWGIQKGDGCELGICGWGNGEHQYYTDNPRNVHVDDGRLYLRARHERGEDREKLKSYCRSRCAPGDAACYQRCDAAQFSSGRIHTSGKFSIAPGVNGHRAIRVAVRFKVTPGAGLWPAVWMLPEPTAGTRCSGCGRYGVWAASGEIDVMEAANGMTDAVGTIHYGAPWPNNKMASSSMGMDPSQWHVMTFIWRKTNMEWYLDGKFVGSQKSSNNDGSQNGWFSEGAAAGSNAPFNTNFYLILNLAVGGGFTGNVPAEASVETLAQGAKSMQIDWIRVYGRR